jgi:arylsulfatase A-like enzyme
VALAAGLAWAPQVAVAGYFANRAWGIRPSELATARGLVPNLGLVAGAVALWAVVTWLLVRAVRKWGGEPAEATRRRARRGAAAAAAVAAGALALHLGVAWGLGRPAPGKAERPDLIVLLVDALRADHVGAYGYPRETTPAIDTLARDGIVFRQAVAASTFTKSSIASLFTGRFPFQHGVYWGSRRDDSGAVRADLFGDDAVTLAEMLRDRGYLTEAWVQNSHLVSEMGFGQGFVGYRDQQGGAARITRLLERWLGGPGRRYPYFAYVHYIDLHDPYLPPPPYDAMFGDPAGRDLDPYRGIDLGEWGAYLEAVRRGERTVEPERLERLEALYDGQLRAVDDRIGELLDRLRRLGLYESSLIVVTAAHGDGFGEHGFNSHSTGPYEELVRVPLLVKLPGGRAGGTAIDRQVRLVDLFPTLLDAAGVGEAGRPEIAGCSLLPLLRAEPGGAVPGRDPACGVAVIEIAEEGAERPTLALRTGRWKFIRREGRPDELYDLAADPGERTDLVAGGLVTGEEEKELGGEKTGKREEGGRAGGDRGADEAGAEHRGPSMRRPRRCWPISVGWRTRSRSGGARPRCGRSSSTATRSRNSRRWAMSAADRPPHAGTGPSPHPALILYLSLLLLLSYSIYPSALSALRVSSLWASIWSRERRIQSVPFIHSNSTLRIRRSSSSWAGSAARSRVSPGSAARS